MTPTEVLFNILKQRYIDAYEKCNDKKIYKISFDKGWVYLDTNNGFGVTKIRVNKLKLMTETLERRLTQ